MQKGVNFKEGVIGSQRVPPRKAEERATVARGSQAVEEDAHPLFRARLVRPPLEPTESRDASPSQRSRWGHRAQPKSTAPRPGCVLRTCTFWGGSGVGWEGRPV